MNYCRLPGRCELEKARTEQAELARRNHDLERAGEALQSYKDAQARAPQFVPPGHFYSAVPALAEVRARASRIFDRRRRSVGGIDLREDEQLALLRHFAEYYFPCVNIT